MFLAVLIYLFLVDLSCRRLYLRRLRIRSCVASRRLRVLATSFTFMAGGSLKMSLKVDADDFLWIQSGFHEYTL